MRKRSLQIGLVLLLGAAAGPVGFAAKPGGGPPPDPAIAYTVPGNRTTSLMVMNADGSNKRELLKAKVVTGPRWSPDGQQIAFYGDVQGNGIHVIDVDGTDLRKVLATNGGIAGLDWSPVPAPDGNYKLSFGDGPDSERPDLHVVNLDGSGLQRLTDTRDVHETGGSWSPDATRIVMVRGSDAERLVWDLGMVDGALAITGSTTLSLPLDDASSASWARTGDRIVLQGRPEGSPSGPLDLWVVDLSDPTDPVNITNSGGEERFATWSPDDSKVAYWLLDGGQSGIYVRPSDGSGIATRISSNGVNPSWRRNP